MAELLSQIIALVERVGKAILPLYRSQDESLLLLKDDGSPFTKADDLANQMILETLKSLTPDIPIISEESCDVSFAERQNWQRFWLVDPIDGTKEFLAKNGDFTVNIALIDAHRPVLGVVGVPVSGTVYYASEHSGAWKKTTTGVEEIHAVALDSHQAVRVMASRRHGVNAIEKISSHYSQAELLLRGSSLKFCLLAEGLVDLYPRLGFTSEWDTAAGQCIVEAAGGCVMDLNGKPLVYGLRETYQNPYFLAVADPSVGWSQFFS
ncbi:MAG: cysQ [Gammaproteobacteria bacterium]|jgi:3'(2'), 5'-bisphosphate nucleotidase|nr:cysQ [Gammaproteobacteria bacterium]